MRIQTNELINNSCTLSDSQESQIIYHNGNVEIYSNDAGENESTNSILNSAKNHMNNKQSNKKKIILVKNEQDADSNIMMEYNNDDTSMQIRKFLKQVGVGSHQIIENSQFTIHNL